MARADNLMQHVRLVEMCADADENIDRTEAMLNELTHDGWWVHEVTALRPGWVLFTLIKDASWPPQAVTATGQPG